MGQVIQFRRPRRPKPTCLSEYQAQVDQCLRIVEAGKKKHRRAPVYHFTGLDPVS
jgi:hypothetical protein